jgi:hypothetical protein
MATGRKKTPKKTPPRKRAAAPKRPTAAQDRARIEEVYGLRLGGAELADLREYADAPERAWGCTDADLARYLAGADALCLERFDPKAAHLLARHLLQRRQLYAHAMSAGDFRTAHAVLRDEAQLESLYAPPKRTGLEGVSDAELLERLALLRERLARTGGPGAGDGAAVGGPKEALRLRSPEGEGAEAAG